MARPLRPGPFRPGPLIGPPAVPAIPQDQPPEDSFLHFEEDVGQLVVAEGYQQSNADFIDGDAWDWASDGADQAPDFWVELEAAVPSAPVSADQPPACEWDDLIDQAGLYEEPPIETWEWSNPINPNAPPDALSAEDPFLIDEVDDDFYDDFGNDEGEPNLDDGAWDFFSDGFEADEWAVIGDDDDDAVGADATSPGAPIEDSWDWFELVDDADLTALDDADDAIAVDASPFPPEDPWEWTEDVHDPEPPAEYAFVDFVAPAASPPEDAWPHDDFGEEPDLHALLDDDDDVVGPDAPADQFAETWQPDEDFDDGAVLLDSAPVADTDFSGQDDLWPWSEDAGDELALDDGAFADITAAASIFEDPIALDEIDEDSAFGTDAVGADFIAPPSQFTADGWDWEIDLPTDDQVDEWLAWALAATYAANPCFTVALPPRLFTVSRRGRLFAVALPARPFTVRGPCHMTTLNRFDPKDPGEAQPLLFDFSADLAAGETLAGTVVVSVTVVKGVDPSPNVILAGGNSLDATSTKFFVPVVGGLDGVDYDIVVKYQTTNPKKTLVLGGILPVRAQ